uniref:Putative heme/steroid binding protein n=1 Tax=Anopheles marajoara TaxID=58244 RepID=A0A2M4BX51_9DIPT
MAVREPNGNQFYRHIVLAVAGSIFCYLLITYSGLSYFRRPEIVPKTGEHLFSEAELSVHNGITGESLYLVILGHVYDVTKGAKHYGPGESYHMFVGHDASRSFVTGEFERYSDELSDVSGLTDAELQQLLTWKEFYDKTYPYLGKVKGRYFDGAGQETEYLRSVRARVEKAAAQAALDGPKYPSCNVEWKVEVGTRVWCSNRSGTGQERAWVGRPRKVLSGLNESGHAMQFCACLPDDATDQAMYARFPNCDENAESCVIPDEQ